MVILGVLDNIAHPQYFSSFSCGNGRINGEAIVMIEALRLGPGRQGLFPPFHKSLLKIRNRLSAVGVARGDDAPLTRIMAEELDIANLKRLQFPRLAEEMVFPERLDAFQFEIATKAASHIFDG